MFKQMSRFVVGLMVVAGMVSSASADWSDAVFPIKEHNFGTVAVASKTEFRFPVVNTLDRALHIRTVRASCGCTTPIVESEYIEPGQTGVIVAKFNTGTFRGQRGATLTVVIDQPVFREVQLRVDGYIRRDMVFHPGEVEFAKVDSGTASERTASVMYAGRSDWKILDVVSNQAWLEPAFRQTLRGEGKVNYELTVKLREDAPPGPFQEEIIVLTDDRSMPRVPLRITGEIESLISVSPQLISLGSLKPGQVVEQKLVIRGREPFTISSIQCEGWEVDFDPVASPKTLHLLSARFRAVAAEGPQKVSVVIQTSGAESISGKALLTAVVRDR